MSDTQALDCRGLQCPQPVMAARKALDAMPVGDLTVLVSLEVQVTNLVQLSRDAGWSADSESHGDHFSVTIHKSGPPAAQPDAAASPAEAQSIAGATFVFGSDALGSGDNDLGRLLIQLLLRTLADGDEVTRRLIFLNTGVNLCCEGSPILDALQALEAKGTEILACGTCLDYLGRVKAQRVGRVTNMHDIVGYLVSARPLISAL
jgi:selenium metabolism protein YedF